MKNKLKDLKKEDKRDDNDRSKIIVSSIIIGFLVSIFVLFILNYKQKYSFLTISIALIVFVILAMFVSLKLCGKIKPKPMSSESWIYTGISVFMIGTIIESLNIFKVLGFVYFIAGLFRRKIEKNNISEAEEKKLIFYILLSSLLLFILGMIFYILFRKN